MQTPLVLASASPRRSEILKMAGIPFDVIPSQFKEPRHEDHLANPLDFALEMAREKGKEVYARLNKERTVLAADTIGLLGDRVLEKPKDRDDAADMLHLMSGKTHQVITAYAIFTPGNNAPKIGTVTTDVTFKSLSEEEIKDYLDNADYMDKAAAYAIQGLASKFVERIEGEYFNVVGLPICEISKKLKG